MSADIVNLRLVRKRKAREDEQREAEARRAAFGRTKAEKSLAKARKNIADRALDGHRLNAPDE